MFHLWNVGGSRVQNLQVSIETYKLHLLTVIVHFRLNVYLIFYIYMHTYGLHTFYRLVGPAKSNQSIIL